MDVIARAIVGREALQFSSTEAFWAWHVEDAAGLERPVDRAIAGGSAVDRPGFAFAAGYGAALHALLPILGRSTLASLAATEEGGAHPRAIQTTLTREGPVWRLSGHKRWVILAGTKLLVLARVAQQSGESPEARARLRVALVERSRAGVQIVPQPPAPFVPEVMHAEVVLDRVEVRDDDLLPGDGWDDWVKPFRTVEDIHVHAAILAYLLSVGARAQWPTAVRERLASLLVSLRALAAESPRSPGVHLALAGAIAGTRAVVEELSPLWSEVPEPVRAAWERDRVLLDVAGKARTARTVRAWEQLTQYR